MRKATYKGGHLPFTPGREYNVRIIFDDDCDYVYLYNCDTFMKCVYDGREELEREWELSES